MRGKGCCLGIYLDVSAWACCGSGEMKFCVDGNGELGGRKNGKGHMAEKTYGTPFMVYPLCFREGNFPHPSFRGGRRMRRFVCFGVTKALCRNKSNPPAWPVGLICSFIAKNFEE